MIAKPFLKFAGGKTALLPEIRKRIPDKFRQYVEPFVGGGAVFFALAASGKIKSKPILGDNNEELIETYCDVRLDVDTVIAGLKIHERKHSEEYYYKTRASHAVNVAPRMIYLNKTGFNGLYRVNKKGEFNTPFGRYTNPTICDEENLRACAAALKNVEFFSGDFESTMEQAKKGDFCYCDPPYVPVSTTSNFTSYTRDGFTLDDQKRLADCARRLVKRGVHVLLSNSDTPLVRKLYKGFKLEKVEAPRRINSKGGKRGNVGELLISGSTK